MQQRQIGARRAPRQLEERKLAIAEKVDSTVVTASRKLGDPEQEAPSQAEAAQVKVQSEERGQGGGEGRSQAKFPQPRCVKPSPRHHQEAGPMSHDFSRHNGPVVPGACGVWPDDHGQVGRRRHHHHHLPADEAGQAARQAQEAAAVPVPQAVQAQVVR
jgi:hypothetical protein